MVTVKLTLFILGYNNEHSFFIYGYFITIAAYFYSQERYWQFLSGTTQFPTHLVVMTLSELVQ